MPIRKVPGGFKIDNTAGTSSTREAALRRLAAIKANQGSKKSSHNSDHKDGNTHKDRKPRRGGRVTMHNRTKKK